ncbi:MAG: ribonuclease H-like domain-containing protein [Candidatus Acidiferrales bacterium]
MKNASDRLARVSALRAPRRSSTAKRGYATNLPEGAARLAELLAASPATTKYGEHLSLRRWFAEPSGCDAPLDGLSVLAPGAPKEAFDIENWLFLDTETTGMAGGTGTYAFLVGVAWWEAGGLQVEQFFMRDFSEEHSVLVALAERMASRRVLVTFNGKTFDWPLLETRYRMTRAISPRSPSMHLDLLHPARRLWRMRLGSARLQDLERHILGWDRGVDVMSELIPQIYFEYVRGGSADPLVPVFRHNQMDLQGLAALSQRMLNLLAAPEASGGDPRDLYGLSRLFEQRGEAARARQLCERALAEGLPEEISRVAKRGLAMLAKREADFPRATALWEDLRADSHGGIEDALEASVQLAIYLEHRAARPQHAADVTCEALKKLRRATRSGSIDTVRGRRLEAAFQHRLKRLKRKLDSCSGSLLEAKVAGSFAAPGESNRG